MIKDFVGTIKKVAQFCNKQLDGEAIVKIAEACSFQTMKKQMTGVVGSLDNTISHFFRKGKVGDWKNTLNEEESNWIDEKCKEYLDPIGLTFEYKI